MAKLNSMEKVFKQWQDTKKTAVIQFNYPSHVALAASISDAIRNHFVTADVNGIELLKEFGMGTPDEPSVMQVRATIGCL